VQLIEDDEEQEPESRCTTFPHETVLNLYKAVLEETFVKLRNGEIDMKNFKKGGGKRGKRVQK